MSLEHEGVSGLATRSESLQAREFALPFTSIRNRQIQEQKLAAHMLQACGLGSSEESPAASTRASTHTLGLSTPLTLNM